MSQYIQIPLLFPDDPIEIPISKGKHSVRIDYTDSDLTQYTWHVNVIGGKWVYCSRMRLKSDPLKPRAILIHRVIMERILGRDIPPKMVVDHIDGDGLNNTRSNLRLATNAENIRNCKRYSSNSTGFKGVCFSPTRDHWQAIITVNGKQKFLGNFDNPEDAHAAYQAAAKQYFGEFARFD